MVEYKKLDGIFQCLSDKTRRDILRRVIERELSINEVASAYRRQMSLAAVSKHLRVLEEAKLVIKRRRGKQLFVALSPPAFKEASEYLERFRELWEDRFKRLDQLLQEQK